MVSRPLKEKLQGLESCASAFHPPSDQSYLRISPHNDRTQSATDQEIAPFSQSNPPESSSPESSNEVHSMRSSCGDCSQPSGRYVPPIAENFDTLLQPMHWMSAGIGEWRRTGLLLLILGLQRLVFVLCFLGSDWLGNESMELLRKPVVMSVSVPSVPSIVPDRTDTYRSLSSELVHLIVSRVQGDCKVRRLWVWCLASLLYQLSKGRRTMRNLVEYQWVAALTFGTTRPISFPFTNLKRHSSLTFHSLCCRIFYLSTSTTFHGIASQHLNDSLKQYPFQLPSLDFERASLVLEETGMAQDG